MGSFFLNLFVIKLATLKNKKIQAYTFSYSKKTSCFINFTSRMKNKKMVRKINTAFCIQVNAVLSMKMIIALIVNQWFPSYILAFI